MATGEAADPTPGKDGGMVLRVIRGDANQPVARFTCDQIGGRVLSAVGFARTDVSSANPLVTKFIVGRLLTIAGVACEWDGDCVTLLGNGLRLRPGPGGLYALAGLGWVFEVVGPAT